MEVKIGVNLEAIALLVVGGFAGYYVVAHFMKTGTAV